MNENLKEIQSGFLRGVGGALLALLLSILSPWILPAIGLSPSGTSSVYIRLVLAGAGIFWLGRLSCSFGRIRIHKAVWATAKASKDVTETVRKEIEEKGRRDIPATNEFLLGPDKDIDHGTPKTLSVEYTKFGKVRQKSEREFGRLEL